jgi:hypothetical protein
MLNHNPFDVAACIIKDIKDSVKLREKIIHVDIVERSLLIEELKIKNEVLNNYLKAEKNKITEERQQIQKEFGLLQFFQKSDEKKTEKDFIKKSIERLFEEKKTVQKEKEEINAVINAVKCLEENISKSLSHYTETYKNIYNIYSKLDNKMKELWFLFEKYPKIFGNS